MLEAPSFRNTALARRFVGSPYSREPVLHPLIQAALVVASAFILLDILTPLASSVIAESSTVTAAERTTRGAHAVSYGAIGWALSLVIRSGRALLLRATAPHPGLGRPIGLAAQVLQYLVGFFFAGIALQNITTRSVTLTTLTFDANYLGMLFGPVACILADALLHGQRNAVSRLE